VEKGNLKGWFDAGVCAVGMGSKLITKDILINRRFDKMAQQTKDALALIKEVRANH
jgi:2-dehydro-3-deoxyphosphogluconate aldolase/(4S)-4-hydroxy-2-oxoglutarate aldolase